jgi:hypothetical protein
MVLVRWREKELNPHMRVYEALALPLSYLSNQAERTGFEPVHLGRWVV